MSAAAPDSAAWLTIGQGEVTYTQDEAEAVLAGFAFATRPLTWPSSFSPPGGHGLAAAPRAAVQSTWSYRIYDCAPNSPHAFGVNDLLVIAALDSGAGGAEFLAMEAILPDLNEVLAHLDVAQTFWTLPRADLGIAPPGVAPAWWLWRAWALLMGLGNVGPTITHKVLHHKRPWLFPIFDDDTLSKMGGKSAWQVLHDELDQQAAQFMHLEQWFAAEAVNRGGACLTRLRIHDILHWGAITRSRTEREPLIRAGHDVLGR